MDIIFTIGWMAAGVYFLIILWVFFIKEPKTIQRCPFCGLSSDIDMNASRKMLLDMNEKMLKEYKVLPHEFIEKLEKAFQDNGYVVEIKSGKKG